MGSPKSARDGPFLKFEGWDVVGHDVGRYFTDLSGEARINALKAATLRYGSRFFAFNSHGWSKTWTNLDPKELVPGESTLYIRVEFPGWVYHPEADIRGNDLSNVGVTATPAIIQAINNRANPFDVVAFNESGWVKSDVGPPSSNYGFLAGYYVREDIK